ESMLAFVIARAFLEKFSGDSLDEIRKSYSVYQAYLKRVWKWEKI
ncbi:MAG TPA: chorismate synthase, partial [Syntrophomonas wolfei]|nr:chorismate synthase [Syntrophomonas wolfei]